MMNGFHLWWLRIISFSLNLLLFSSLFFFLGGGQCFSACMGHHEMGCSPQVSHGRSKAPQKGWHPGTSHPELVDLQHDCRISPSTVDCFRNGLGAV